MGFNDRRGGGFGRDRDGGRGGFGGRGSFGGGRGGFGGGRRDRGPVEMHSAVCDKCKKECEVPFKPTAGKQVLCSDCFSNAGGSRRDMNSSGGGMSAEQFNKLDAKLNKILDILKEIEFVDDDEDMDDDSEDEKEDDGKITPLEDEDSDDGLVEDESEEDEKIKEELKEDSVDELDESDEEMNDNSEDKAVA